MCVNLLRRKAGLGTGKIRQGIFPNSIHPSIWMEQPRDDVRFGITEIPVYRYTETGIAMTKIYTAKPVLQI